MTPLLLLAVLFLCGLINSYFFPLSSLLARLRSLHFKPPVATASRKPPIAPPKDDGKKKRKNDLETIFPTFDSDGDGFITAKELEESLERLKLSATPEEVREMMGRVDANGDGMIDAEEFRDLYESLEGKHGGGGGGAGDDGEVDLREAFEVFDGNGDGVITVEELGAVLVSMGLKQGAKAEDCRRMISRVDLDGDGRVNFEEFKKMMTMAAKF